MEEKTWGKTKHIGGKTGMNHSKGFTERKNTPPHVFVLNIIEVIF